MKQFFYLFIITAGLCLTLSAAVPEWRVQMEKIQALENDRNYRDAVSAGEKLLFRKDCPLEAVPELLGSLGNSLSRLNRYYKIDSYFERLLKSRAENWELYWRLGKACGELRPFGFIQDGEFRRGYQRGSSGRRVNVSEHDRRQMLHWYERSRQMLAGSGEKVSASVRNDFYRDYGEALLEGCSGPGSWRRQLLTDLDTVPGWEAPAPEGQTDGAPVDAQGAPLFSRLPESFAKAANDGERALQLQEERLKLGKDAVKQVLRERADDSRSLYGVQLLFRRNGFRSGSDDRKQPGWLLEAKKLRDNESLTRLASGTRRIVLPERQAYIPLYQRLSREFGDAEACLDLIRVYLNRARPDKALEWCRYGLDLLKKQSPPDKALQEHFSSYRHQLEGSFCQLMPCGDILPAGRQNSLSLEYRNTDLISLNLEQADSRALLQAFQHDLKAGTSRSSFYGTLPLTSWFQEDSPYRKHLRPRGQAWTVRTKGKIPYRNRFMDISLPSLPSGIYVLTARTAGGSVSRIPLIISSCRLLGKTLLDGRKFWQLLDAENGRPVSFRELHFICLGYSYNTRNGVRSRELQTAEFSAVTDGNGGILLDSAKYKGLRNLEYFLCYSRDDRNSFLLTASSVRFSDPPDPVLDHPANLLITDRPLYRPGQQVNLKLWLQNATWRENAVNPFAEKPLTVLAESPDGRQIWSSSDGRTDSFGGWNGAFTLPEDIRLGSCAVYLKTGREKLFCGSFLVEEYRKPEFEVTISGPEKLPLLGGKVPLTIRGRYYFGEPVRKGTATVKILRYEHRGGWRPLGGWDWLYGSGSSLVQGDYGWCPLWRQYGGGQLFLPPFRPSAPPEVVLEQETELDSAGELQLMLDSARAKELHGDCDHRYVISVVVRDSSRRSIAAEKELIISREKFQIAAWLPRGFYHAGEKITALAQACDASGQPVRVRGHLRIFRVLCHARTGQIREEQIQKHGVKSGEDGSLSETVKLKEAGQYRFQWECSDGEAEVTGTAMVNVYGNAGEEKHFRYNDLELTTDKAEYRPGESVRLRISTDAADSFVLLFIRTRDGLYPRPVYLQLLGKSMEYPVPVTPEDYPGFFVEAGMVRNGRWHWASREIKVPPEKRRLSLEILPEQKELKPGAASLLKIRLTDSQGRPFQGSAVLTVYDKSLEAVSGGSNVPAIFPRFWNWKSRYWHRTEEIQWQSNVIRFDDDPEFMRPLSPWSPMEEDMLYEESGMIRSRGARMLGAAAPMMKMNSMMAADSAAEAEAEDRPASPVLIRSNFTDTACWRAEILTGPDGTAVIPLKMPDSLTTWKIRVWAMGEKTEAGQAETEIITARDLMIRLAAPRFFTEKDEAVLQAIVHNRRDSSLKLQTELKLLNDCIVLKDGEENLQKRKIRAEGEEHFDWTVRAARTGEARVQVVVRSEDDSDGLEMKIPVQERSFARKLAFTGILEPETQRQQCSFGLPEEYRQDPALLELSWSPLPAAAVAEAVPGLMEPACESSDHILYSFLPAVLLDRALRSCGLSLEQIAAGASLNPGTREAGRKPDRLRWQAPENYSAEALKKLSESRLKQLEKMQCADGGWSWFSGYGARSQSYITAQVVQGLLQAADLKLISRDWKPLRRGLAWLKQYQKDEYRKMTAAAGKKPGKALPDELDARIHWVLAAGGSYHAGMAMKLFDSRKDLSLQAIAAMAMAETYFLRRTSGQLLAPLLHNLEQFLRTDAENQTAWLETGEDAGFCWWYWYNDPIESQAIYLQLLLRTGQSRTAAARGLTKYLLAHRRNGSFWRSGKDSARVLTAFAEYLQATGGDLRDHTVQIELDGRILDTVSYSAAAPLQGRRRLFVPGKDLKPGSHTVTIRKSGKAPLYFNAWMDYFSREEQIGASGLDLKISRNFYRIRRQTAEMPAPDARGGIHQKATENELRELLKPGDVLRPGDLLEAELILESKNHCEFLKLEDFRAAGLEPLDRRSGYTGNSLGAYTEFRDNRIVMYLHDLPHGRSSVRYRLRAETPGVFTALPARIQGVYAPELYGNSPSLQIRMQPREQ